MSFSIWLVGNVTQKGVAPPFTCVDSFSPSFDDINELALLRTDATSPPPLPAVWQPALSHRAPSPLLSWSGHLTQPVFAALSCCLGGVAPFAQTLLWNLVSMWFIE